MACKNVNGNLKSMPKIVNGNTKNVNGKIFLALETVETREEFPYLPQHQPDDSLRSLDDSLRSLPPDVLFLSKNHSIKGNNN